METRANYLLIGSFALAGFVGLLLFLMWFAGHESNRQYDYYQVVFPEISGISAGTQVQFSGVPVGQVVDLALDPDGRVRVQLELRQDTPVRLDSVATMVPQGITGLSILSVSSGSASAPLLRETTDQPVPEIRSGRSMLESITDSAPEMVEQLSDAATRLNQMLGDENRDHVASILRNVDGATAKLDTALEDIAAATSGLAAVGTTLQDFAAQFDGVAPKVRDALDSAKAAGDQIARSGKVVEDMRLPEIASQVEGIAADLRAMLGSEDAAQLPRSLSETLKSASALLSDLHASGSARNLNEMMLSFRRAADGITTAVQPAAAHVARAAAGVQSVAAGLGDRGALQTDLRRAAREIANAAAAVQSMARTIERQPNSLIRGR